MKPLFWTILLSVLPLAAACPAKPTLFNGSVPVTVYGLRPYCTTQGRGLANSFKTQYLQTGAKIYYVEGYRLDATDEETVTTVLNSLENLLKSIGYQYVDQGEGDYNTLYIYKKSGTATRGTVISVETTEKDTIYVITNGEFSWLK
ncbi:hypothetical protein [Deinococcus gobiensis]|uniref:Lipoprotein n=1 Tax=Deinococcus gobiensis (strain DSM 21396 / JCM 16679 / CGMCC 1.7299 / I-0) TaxID=745776 RepID=H8H2C3_DEIGI|nr:hypothetical protein [Deinococcus gobiensis]AFD27670.1 hypothetical protein DGo_PB0401 [Deinococcus gobiensis I-0]